jgi:hypothetical protein
LASVVIKWETVSGIKLEIERQKGIILFLVTGRMQGWWWWWWW